MRGAAAGAGLRSRERAEHGDGDDERARDRDRQGALPVDAGGHVAQGRRDGIAARHVAFARHVASYQDLLAEVKSQIHEISAADAAARLSSDEPPVLIDVREPDEFDQGAIDGAVHIPRGYLESRIERRRRPISRRRSSSAASRARARRSRAARSRSSATRTSLARRRLRRAGSRAASPGARRSVLSEAQRARYSRHMLIPEVGEAGQMKLLESTVLLLGAGGLGSPAGLYLAAAGVGTIGDRRRRHRRRVEPAAPGAALDGVDRHAEDGVGPSSASRSSTPTSASSTYRERLTSENIDRHPRGLRRDRRRHRQLPDALPAERRERAAPHPGRARLDLPLRGPADGLQAATRARATAASSRSRRRRSSRRRAPRAACSACCPASWARCRRARRSSCCSTSASRLVGRLHPVRRARHELPRGAAAPRPRLPRLRRRRRARSSTSTTRSSACRPRGRRPDMASFRLPPVLRAHGRRRPYRRGGRRQPARRAR